MRGDFLGGRRVPISRNNRAQGLSGVESLQTVTLSKRSQDMHTHSRTHSQAHTNALVEVVSGVTLCRRSWPKPPPSTLSSNPSRLNSQSPFSPTWSIFATNFPCKIPITIVVAISNRRLGNDFFPPRCCDARKHHSARTDRVKGSKKNRQLSIIL